MGKRKTPIKWSAYNKELVERGRMIVKYIEEFKENEDLLEEEVKEMNKGKEGARFVYSNSLIVFLGVIKVCTMKGYRWLNGFAYYFLREVPDYSQICRRINRLPNSLMEEINKHVVKAAVTSQRIEIIHDDTGIQINGKYIWQDEKNGKRRERKWKKIHVVIDSKSRAILSMRVLNKDKNGGESKEFEESLKEVEKHIPENTKIEKDYGDGAYDSNANFELCKSKGIEPVIRIREPTRERVRREEEINERLRLYGRELSWRFNYREKCALEQKDWYKFVEKSRYGKRSGIEGVFGSFKRMFGEMAYSKLDKNIKIEYWLKSVVWNLMMCSGGGREMACSQSSR